MCYEYPPEMTDPRDQRIRELETAAKLADRCLGSALTIIDDWRAVRGKPIDQLPISNVMGRIEESVRTARAAIEKARTTP